MGDTDFRLPAEVRSRQEKGFAALMRRVLQSNRFYRKKYRKLAFASGRPVGLSDLPSLPLLDRRELLRDQQSHPPFGTNLTFDLARYTRLHQVEGGALRWLDTEDSWSWWLDCWVEAYRSSRVTPESHVFVACSFGPSIGFWSGLEAAQRLGALAISGGASPPESQLETLLQCQASVLVTTPRNARRLAQAAGLAGYDLATCSLRMVLHTDETDDAEEDAGEASGAFKGDRVDVVASTEAGVWAHGCGHGDRLHVHESEFVVEVIDPESLEPVPLGDSGTQRGELVLTNLGRVGSPLIRYATGQIVELSRPACACGRNTAVIRLAAGPTAATRSREAC